ncbi:MAG: pyridoxal-dependent decarboxylase, partial [Pseudomonadota bacterium]
LGRRFRALKLWFLMRAHGLEDLRRRIRDHIRWTEKAEARIEGIDGLEVVTTSRLALFSFARSDGDEATMRLLEAINDDGRTYLTPTVHEGRQVIRLTIGQFDTTKADVDFALDAVEELHRRV